MSILLLILIQINHKVEIKAAYIVLSNVFYGLLLIDQGVSGQPDRMCYHLYNNYTTGRYLRFYTIKCDIPVRVL